MTREEQYLRALWALVDAIDGFKRGGATGVAVETYDDALASARLVLASPADALPVVPLDEGDYFRARDQARRAPPAAHAGTPMQREAEASIALDRDQTHYVGDDCPGGHRDAHAGTPPKMPAIGQRVTPTLKWADAHAVREST